MYYPPPIGVPWPGLSGPRWGSSGAILQVLTLSANAFTVGDPQGTLIGNIQNTTPGSNVVITGQSVANALQITLVSGVWKLQVGPSAPGSSGTLTFNLIETLAGAFNSPLTTMTLSVTEMAAAGSAPIIQLDLDFSKAFPPVL